MIFFNRCWWNATIPCCKTMISSSWAVKLFFYWWYYQCCYGKRYVYMTVSHFMKGFYYIYKYHQDWVQLFNFFQRLKKLFCKLSFQAGDLCIQCPHNVSTFSLIKICNQYINNTQIIACPLLNRNLLSQVNISHLLSFSDARYYQHSIVEHSNPTSSPQRKPTEKFFPSLYPFLLKIS